MANVIGVGSNEIYFMILTYRMNDRWWSASAKLKSKVLQKLQHILETVMKKLLLMRAYKSLRSDSDIIFWLASKDPEALSDFKIHVNSALSGLGQPNFSLLSVYEESPYVGVKRDLKETLSDSPLRFFVAYPMSKDPEWYLLDFEERKKIMGEHIGMARSHPESKMIRSYSTYSYGIGDYEFVVVYETQSLASWSRVTGKLREAKARKWIVNEEPILVGALSDPSFLGAKR